MITTKLYEKKPVRVEALQYTPDSLNDLMNWVPGLEEHDGKLLIKTLEGVMEAQPGDYIIRGIKGEFYPCKPDIFEATYEFIRNSEPLKVNIPAGTLLLCFNEDNCVGEGDLGVLRRKEDWDGKDTVGTELGEFKYVMFLSEFLEKYPEGTYWIQDEDLIVCRDHNLYRLSDLEEEDDGDEEKEDC